MNFSELLDTFKDKDLDWIHPCFTWEFVCSNLDREYDWYAISILSDISWEIVCANPDKN